MHAHAMVARVREPRPYGLHAKHARALTGTVAALLSGGRDSLSAIALHLSGSCAYKHRIKAVDRLLGNAALHRDRADLYQALAQWCLNDVTLYDHPVRAYTNTRIRVVGILQGDKITGGTKKVLARRTRHNGVHKDIRSTPIGTTNTLSAEFPSLPRKYLDVVRTVRKSEVPSACSARRVMGVSRTRP